MSAPQSAAQVEAQPALVPRWLASRRLWWIAGLAALAAAAALRWEWLVATGLASLLTSVLPCVAMCALGLCMNRGGGKSCHGSDKPQKAERGSV